jgi:CO dehydrogenase/acetyl-CoA synthase beta subunit
MELFDERINNILKLLANYTAKSFSFDSGKVLPSGGRSELVLLKDSAFELGGSGLPSVGLSCVTQNIGIENRTLLIGRDLNEIDADCAYAKIVLLQIKEGYDSEQALFDAIKQLEYVKYKVFVDGFMTRASAMNHREQVRVSKAALKSGLSFEKIGNTLINEYLKRDGVSAASIVFITEPSFGFRALENEAAKIGEITSALNHMLDNVLVDCKSCSLKPICDEVEGMREMHLKAAARGTELG